MCLKCLQLYNLFKRLMPFSLRFVDVLKLLHVVSNPTKHTKTNPLIWCDTLRVYCAQQQRHSPVGAHVLHVHLIKATTRAQPMACRRDSPQSRPHCDLRGSPRCAQLESRACGAIRNLICGRSKAAFDTFFFFCGERGIFPDVFAAQHQKTHHSGDTIMYGLNHSNLTQLKRLYRIQDWL